MHTLAAHLHHLRVEVDDEISCLDDGLGVALGAAHDGVNARHQFVLVEWLRHVVIGAEAETFDLILDAGEAERIRVGVFTLETRRLRSTSKPDMSGRLRSRRMMS